MRFYDELSPFSVPRRLDLSNSEGHVERIAESVLLHKPARTYSSIPRIRIPDNFISLEVLDETQLSAIDVNDLATIMLENTYAPESIETDQPEENEAGSLEYDARAYADLFNEELQNLEGLNPNCTVTIRSKSSDKPSIEIQPIKFGFMYMNMGENAGKFLDLLGYVYEGVTTIERNGIVLAVQKRYEELEIARQDSSLTEETSNYMRENIQNGFLPVRDTPDVFFDTNNRCFVVAEEEVSNDQESLEEGQNILTSAA